MISRWPEAIHFWFYTDAFVSIFTFRHMSHSWNIETMVKGWLFIQQVLFIINVFIDFTVSDQIFWVSVFVSANKKTIQHLITLCHVLNLIKNTPAYIFCSEGLWHEERSHERNQGCAKTWKVIEINVAKKNSSWTTLSSEVVWLKWLPMETDWFGNIGIGYF